MTKNISEYFICDLWGQMGCIGVIQLPNILQSVIQVYNKLHFVMQESAFQAISPKLYISNDLLKSYPNTICFTFNDQKKLALQI